MPISPASYVRCDDLESLSELHRENYLAELERLHDELPARASVLQVGSMDGRRMIRLSRMRPDLRLTGLDIDADLVMTARNSVRQAVVDAQFVIGDITCPPDLGGYDYVICLGNTLAYIDDESGAMNGMKALGDVVVVSIYGERFDDAVAASYFDRMGLTMGQAHSDRLVIRDFGDVRRYSLDRVTAWGGAVRSTPVGYWCEIRGMRTRGT